MNRPHLFFRNPLEERDRFRQQRWVSHAFVGDVDKLD